MMNRILRTKGALISISLLFIPFITFAGNIKGSIKDKTSHEVLIGATNQFDNRYRHRLRRQLRADQHQ